MSGLPTKYDIEKVYKPAFKFLDSISQIISEAEADNDSESLRLRSEKIEYEMEALRALSNRLSELRAHAASSLYSLERLDRLQAISDEIKSSRMTERLRQSGQGVIEIVVILGERLTDWLNKLSGSRSCLYDESDDSNGFNELLESLPTDVAEELRKAIVQSPTNSQVAQCYSLLEDEKTILLTISSDEPAEEKGEKKLSETGTDDTGKKTRGISKRSKDQIFLAALRKWHNFETSDFNYKPASLRDLASLINEDEPGIKGYSKSSLQRLFDEVFDGHKQYKIHCNQKTIVQELKARSGEYSPHMLRLDLEVEAKAMAKEHGLRDDD